MRSQSVSCFHFRNAAHGFSARRRDRPGDLPNAPSRSGATFCHSTANMNGLVRTAINGEAGAADVRLFTEYERLLEENGISRCILRNPATAAFCTGRTPDVCRRIVESDPPLV